MDLIGDPVKMVSHTQENTSQMDEKVTSMSANVYSVAGKSNKALVSLKTKEKCWK